MFNKPFQNVIGVLQTLIAKMKRLPYDIHSHVVVWMIYTLKEIFLLQYPTNLLNDQVTVVYTLTHSDGNTVHTTCNSISNVLHTKRNILATVSYQLIE